MTFTYDLTTNAGKVRLLCTDTDSTREIFDDDEIAAFLSMEGSTVKKAAALALETIASSEVLVQKRIRLLDLTTDGPSESQELLRRARELRDQAEIDELEDYSGLDYAEMIYDPFSAREKLIKRNLEDGT